MVVIKPQPSFYTPEQLDAYLDFLGIPEVKGHPTADSLQKIIRHSLFKIPFENTEMHYTEKGDIDVTPQGVYKRIVVDQTGGSFCFGQNTLLLGMLLALGYRAYGTLGRTNLAPGDLDVELSIHAHMFVLAQIPTETDTKAPIYIADLGFGIGLVRALLLEDGAEVMGLWPGLKHRVVKTLNPTSNLDLQDPESAQVAEQWSVRTNERHGGTLLPEGQWRTLFHFTLQEFSLPDFWATSRLMVSLPYGPLWETVLCIKWYPIPGEEEAIGTRNLRFSKIVERGPDGLVVLEEFKTEEDRIKALKQYFGIIYPLESTKYITRTMGALKEA